jgi:hypothetical protein
VIEYKQDQSLVQQCDFHDCSFFSKVGILPAAARLAGFFYPASVTRSVHVAFAGHARKSIAFIGSTNYKADHDLISIKADDGVLMLVSRVRNWFRRTDDSAHRNRCATDNRRAGIRMDN